MTDDAIIGEVAPSPSSQETTRVLNPYDDDPHLENTLLSHLCVSCTSDTSSASYTLIPTPTNDNPIHVTAQRNVTHDSILGPVPETELEAAVDAWLRTHRQSSVDELMTGEAFAKALQLPRPPKRLRARMRYFRRFARQKGMQADDVPLPGDLRRNRNRPQALRALAVTARAVDAAGWAALSRGVDLGTSWRDVMLDEAWRGDGTARRLAGMLGGRGTVVVAGQQGTGKSATIGRLLGRVGVPASHALSLSPLGGGEGAEMRTAWRALRAHAWPHMPLAMNEASGASAVDRVHTRLDGRVLSFVELPAMEWSAGDMDERFVTVDVEYGDFESVVRDVQGIRAAAVLAVERLDDVQTDGLFCTLRRLTRLFGKGVLARLIVVLTHGQSVPPVGMSYDVWLYDRKRLVADVVRRVARATTKSQAIVEVPVVVIENSESCCTETGTGRLVLPDGTPFVEQFMREMGHICGRTDIPPYIVPVATRRWWENYMVIGVLVLMAARL